MTTEQRLQAQKKQADLDQATAERYEAEAKAREAEAKQKATQLETRRQQARYGDRLQCVLSGAEARIGGNWRGIEPTPLDVVKGLEVEFTMAEPSSNYSRRYMKGYARFDGQTLSICRDSNPRPNTVCAKVVGTFEDFRKGISTGIDAHDFVHGTLKCDFAPGEGMPQRVIIQR